MSDFFPLAEGFQDLSTTVHVSGLLAFSFLKETPLDIPNFAYLYVGDMFGLLPSSDCYG